MNESGTVKNPGIKIEGVMEVASQCEHSGKQEKIM